MKWVTEMTTLTLNPTLNARGRTCPPVARHFIEGNKFFVFRPDKTMEIVPIFRGDREEFVRFYQTRTPAQIAVIWDQAYNLADDINKAFDDLGGFADAINHLLSVGIYVIVEDN